MRYRLVIGSLFARTLPDDVIVVLSLYVDVYEKDFTLHCTLVFITLASAKCNEMNNHFFKTKTLNSNILNSAAVMKLIPTISKKIYSINIWEKLSEIQCTFFG